MKRSHKPSGISHVSLWQRGKMWELIPNTDRPLYARALFYLLSEANYRTGDIAGVSCVDILSATGAKDIKHIYAVLKALQADGFIAVIKSSGRPNQFRLRSDFWRAGKTKGRE